MKHAKIHVGFQKGSWTVVEAAPPDEAQRTALARERWLCVCRCGHHHTHTAYSLLYSMNDRSACRSCSARDASARKKAAGG